jgi:hypothetical protein
MKMALIFHRHTIHTGAPGFKNLTFSSLHHRRNTVLGTMMNSTNSAARSQGTVDDVSTTIVFGVLTTGIALFGIVIAVLQLRHMAQLKMKYDVFELA